MVKVALLQLRAEGWMALRQGVPSSPPAEQEVRDGTDEVHEGRHRIPLMARAPAPPSTLASHRRASRCVSTRYEGYGCRSHERTGWRASRVRHGVHRRDLAPEAPRALVSRLI